MGEGEAVPNRVCGARDGRGEGNGDAAGKGVNFDKRCWRSEKELAGEVASTEGFDDDAILRHVRKVML